ncbi:transporter, partial [Streptomyces sp. NPDC057757]|uniref:transporter n=1 Tax=Streptomyces sp. NPDC057757 TaxID=3346241 RepID=UPI0036877578
LQEGAPALAATMIAIILGSWLGKLLDETGIAGTLVRKIVEFGGDRPTVVALGVLAVSALVGTVTGSAPAAMLAGIIGIPAMIAVGVPKVTAAGTVLMGIAVGIPFELPVWQFFSTALELPIPTVRGFMVKLFPFALAAALAFVLIETRRRGTEHAWSLKSLDEKPRSRREELGDAPWYALLAPAIPLVLALGFEIAIIPSLLAGVLYALFTTTRPGELNKRLLRTLYGGFEVAAPPIALFIAIGILLAAVKLPGAVDALEPLVKAVSPQNPVVFVLVFTLLVPLCLYRGPLNVFGLGAGIAGVLIATGIYPAVAVLGMTTSYNQVFGVADPTSTQTVWSAQYAGVTPQQVMARTLPYVWAVALGGLCVTAATYL